MTFNFLRTFSNSVHERWIHTPSPSLRDKIATADSSVQVFSHTEVLDQSPIPSNLACNILLVQLGLKLFIVGKRPPEMAGDEGVYIVSYLLVSRRSA